VLGRMDVEENREGGSCLVPDQRFCPKFF